jgi:hypothetical protein
MDKKKLQQLFSLKEIIFYFNHNDIIEISYTCKYINDYLRPLVRKKLTAIDSKYANESFEEYQNFSAKFSKYFEQNCKQITYLNTGTILMFTGIWHDLNLLTNLRILILERMEDIDVQCFNAMVNGPRSLQTLRLKDINIYVEDKISEVSGHIRLPSNLVKLTIIDVEVMLSGLESVEDDILKIITRYLFLKIEHLLLKLTYQI